MEKQSFLRMQQMFKATTQHRPVLLLYGKVSSKIKNSYLANLATNTLAAHQAIGEVALAGGFVVSSGLPDKHPPDFIEKARGKTGYALKYYGTTKRNQNHDSWKIKALRMAKPSNNADYDDGVLKLLRYLMYGVSSRSAPR